MGLPRMSAREVAKLAKKVGVEFDESPRPKKRKVQENRARGNMFQLACRAHGLPEPESEYPFAKEVGRDYKADWAWPAHKIILESEGGIFGTGPPCSVCGRSGPGGHSSIDGILRDIDKYNLAQTLGFRVYRCTPTDISTGMVFELLKKVFRVEVKPVPGNGVVK